MAATDDNTSFQFQPSFSQNLNNNASYCRVNLTHFILNDKKIRFLCLHPDKQVEIPKCLAECTGIPLFMGCDVLAGCSQAPSNHARIHARYSKLGLATKLILKDFRIEGVKKGSVLWFYSIEGVFRVTFECQERSVQRAVIMNLSDMWMKRYNDITLQEVYDVTIQRDSLMNCWMTQPLSTQPQCSHTTELIQMETTLKKKTNFIVDDISERNVEKPFPKTVNHNISWISKVNATTQTDSVNQGETIIVQFVTSESDKRVRHMHHDEGNDSEQKKISLRNNDQLSKNSYEHSSNGSSQTSSKNCARCSSLLTENLSYEDYLENMLNEMTNFVDRFSTGNKKESLFYLKSVLKLIKFDRNHDTDYINGFPFELIDLYLNNAQNPAFMDNENDQEATPRDIFLCTVSKWIGKQYCLFQNYISDKVEKFKTDYISCIDDLPQSETIVSIIFPKCMQELLKSWIGCDDENTNNILQDSYYTLEDHNYIPSAKRTKYEDVAGNNDKIPYPLIQLILEFANKALVSGVAHVVYSKVCHAI